MSLNRIRLSTIFAIVVLSVIATAIATVSSITGVAAHASSTPIYGTCSSDDHCTPKVRGRFPRQSSSSSVGVQLCGCYAASIIAPFDECEGEPEENCVMAKCGNSCIGMVAYCRKEKGVQTCALKNDSTGDNIEIAG